MKNKLTALAASLFVAANASAALVVPFGVQQNVPVSTVTGAWEWNVVYQDTYNQSNVPIATVFAGIEPTDYVMYAARPTGAANFTLLAAALASDVMTYTPQNATTQSNGVSWYFNGGSIGFAAGGDAISQSSADIQSSNDDKRLSWHTDPVAGFAYHPFLGN